MISPRDTVRNVYVERLTRRDRPNRIDPMLAILVHDHFSHPDWIFERKFDGERCLVMAYDGTVRLTSRNHIDISDQYPEIADALTSHEESDFILDGELVAFERGLTSFSRLQARMHLHSADPLAETGVRVYYYAFDILHLNGWNLEDLPLRERKRLLRRAISYEDPIRFTPHRNEDGTRFLGEACERGWEGLIAKDATSRYTRKRSRAWLKFKCSRGQELVIGGYTEPEGSRVGLGAILVGYYDRDEFVYAGKVGTGFDDATLDRLRDRLSSHERSTSPFDRGTPESSGVHFVTPKLVAEIGFTEWTSDGKLRHPRYLGLRRDKSPRDVVRERPEGSEG